MQIRSLVHRSNSRFKVCVCVCGKGGGDERCCTERKRGDVRKQSKEFIMSLYDALANTKDARSPSEKTRKHL